MNRETRNPAGDYTEALFAPQDALLASILSRLPESFHSWQVSAAEGKLLQLLIGMIGAKRVVEVGTLAGYSALWMARALPEGGHLYTIGKDPAHNAIARQVFAESEESEKITLLEGDAQDMLQGLSAQAPFDMIFIDADKINYPRYLDWAEKHIRPGGLIVGDNTYLFGAVWHEKAPVGTAPATHAAMREFNARLADANKYLGMIIPTAEGMTVAMKRS